MTHPPSPVGADLPSLVNFRDVGGLRTTDGRRLRHGRLFRSDSLQDISEDEAGVLADRLGLGYVIDLRVGAEAVGEGRGPLARRPVGYLNIPLIDVDGPPGQPGRMLLDFYVDHLEHDLNLPVAVETVAHATRRPTLVHCAAGKDRTGLTLLLVELLCGVTMDDVRADFLRTADSMEAIRARLAAWPRYARNMATLSAEIYRCEPHSVEGLLDALQDRYGTAEGWAQAKGVPDAAVERLREHLVEDVVVPSG